MIIMNKKIKSLIITCDARGIIEEIICNSLLDCKRDILLKHFFDIVDPESRSRAQNFLDIINMNKSIFNYEINIILEDKIQPLSFGGISYKGQILIIATNENSIMNKLFEEMSLINNEQANIIRNLFKKTERFSGSGNSDIESNAFNQISQLNNELINMQRKMAKLYSELKEKSIKDLLTGLYNRGYFYEKIPEEIVRAVRLDYRVTLVLADINDFKSVNDNYGHEAGDKLLKDFAELLKNSLRKNFDSIFRFGGDEFVILLVNCSEYKARSIFKKINNKFIRLNNEVSVSFGVVEINTDKDKDIDEYLKIADERMYKLKREYKKNNKNNIY